MVKGQPGCRISSFASDWRVDMDFHCMSEIILLKGKLYWFLENNKKFHCLELFTVPLISLGQLTTVLSLSSLMMILLIKGNFDLKSRITETLWAKQGH
jgi:hypothetical protein